MKRGKYERIPQRELRDELKKAFSNIMYSLIASVIFELIKYLISKLVE